MCFVKILLFGLGVIFNLLAMMTTGDALTTFWWPDVFPSYDEPGDCECDNISSYGLFYALMGRWAIIVPIGLYCLSVLCFLKALGGRRD